MMTAEARIRPPIEFELCETCSTVAEELIARVPALERWPHVQTLIKACPTCSAAIARLRCPNCKAGAPACGLH